MKTPHPPLVADRRALRFSSVSLPLSFLLAVCVLAACDQSASETGSRRPLRKEDSAASCGGHCGGQSSGACWCDERCEELGDCCDDVVAECSAACVIEHDSCIDAPCCEGLVCDGESSTCVAADACAGDGESCIDAPCCEGLSCDGESSTCVAVDACAGDGESCIDAPCCEGLSCDGESSACAVTM